MSFEDAVVGRRFVAKSSNVARIERIGEDAVRALWRREPSDADRQELEAWVVDILDVELTVNVGEAGEAEAYAKFRRTR